MKKENNLLYYVKSLFSQLRLYVIGNKETIEILCAIISTFFIGFASIALSFQSNIFGENQSAPYFEIAKDSDGYIIENSGGYLENATISFNSILNVHIVKTVTNSDGTTSREHHDNPYIWQTSTYNFSSPKQKSLRITLSPHGGNTMGINAPVYIEQQFASEFSSLFADVLEEKASQYSYQIQYLEYITITYINANHELCSIDYSIATNTKNEVELVLIPDSIASIAARAKHLEGFDPTIFGFSDFSARTIISQSDNFSGHLDNEIYASVHGSCIISDICLRYLLEE